MFRTFTACLLTLVLLMSCIPALAATPTDLTAETAADEPLVLIRAGGSFGIALSASGKIYGWGDNASGQLGTGDNKRIYMPNKTVAVGVDGTQVADIQCGNVSTLFLMKDGTVMTCGRNNYGQQGIADAKEYTFTPRVIEGLPPVVQVACGFGQCLARTADGHVWAWGRNSNGQIGNGTKKGVNTPIQLELENIVDIQCGGKFCMAVAADGTVYGWGDNEWGQLLDASAYRNVLTPTVLSISGLYTKIACGGDAAYGLDADGKLWSWGRNDYYQLGAKTSGAKKYNSPIRVAVPEELTFTEIYAYNSHTSALTTEGAVWTWGGVRHGQVGNGEGKWRDLPSVACPESGAVSVAVGSLQSYLLTEDGTLYGCGCNEYGQTGAYPRERYYVYRWMPTGLNLLTDEWVDPQN